MHGEDGVNAARGGGSQVYTHVRFTHRADRVARGDLPRVDLATREGLDLGGHGGAEFVRIEEEAVGHFRELPQFRWDRRR